MNAITAVFAHGHRVYVSVQSPTGGETDSITFSTTFPTEDAANLTVKAMRNKYNIPKYGKDQDECI